MKASIIDLRYRMKDVLRALDRHEKVGIFYYGKLRPSISRSSPCPAFAKVWAGSMDRSVTEIHEPDDLFEICWVGSDQSCPDLARQHGNTDVVVQSRLPGVEYPRTT